MRISPELKAGMFTSRTINFFVLRFMGYRKAISDEFYKDWPAIQRICLERNLHLNQTINHQPSTLTRYLSNSLVNPRRLTFFTLSITISSWYSLYASSLPAMEGSCNAKICAANMPAFLAPFSATVATGTP